MRAPLLLISCILVASACTDEARRATSSRLSPSPATEGTAVTPAQAEIYGAVIRHLVIQDDNFGRGDVDSKVVYVMDGPKHDAGRPRGDVFARPNRPFTADVRAAIQEDLSGDLPPLRFVRDGTEALSGAPRLGELRNGGVLIVLGPIERIERRVQVSNTFWCGGKCSQWLTYVLRERNGQWTVTGTTGPVVGS